MNTKIWKIVLVIIVAIGVVLALQHRTPAPVQETPTGEIKNQVVFYDQMTGEQTSAAFSEHSVTFTNAKLGTMTLAQAISADGARFANADESIVFWNKGDSVFITKNGTIIFNGSIGKPADKQSKLPAGSAPAADPKKLEGTWVWQHTTMRDAPVITPKKAGAFTVTFNTTTNKITGKTDCNSYFGTYKVGSDGVITIGAIGSTLMYCEGSEESLFTGEFATANQYSFDSDGSLLINIDHDAGSMIFKKQ